ncbi:MAG: hypothetical protein ACPGVT_11665 [Maricaulaceae bacterium]
MTDIFKKIKSIEPEDSASLIALGLHPVDQETETDHSRASDTPIELEAKDLIAEAPSHAPLVLTSIDEVNEAVDIDSPPFPETAKDVADPIPERDDVLLRAVDIVDQPIDINAEPESNELEYNELEDNDPEDNDPVPSFISGAAILQQSVKEPSRAEKHPDIRPIEPTSRPVNNPGLEGVMNPYINASHVEEPSQKWVLIFGGTAVFVWLLFSGIAGWKMGFMGTDNAPASVLELMTASLFVILPALLFILFSLACYRLMKLSHHSARLGAAVDAMMKPDETVVARSKIMTKSIEKNVEDINLQLTAALNRMEMLGDVTRLQSSALSQSVLAAQTSTDTINENIETQKSSLSYIVNTLEDRMTTLSKTLDDHAHNVEQSTLAAEQKMTEAQVGIEDITLKLNAVSADVKQSSIEAASTLTGSHEEITQLGDVLKARSTEINAIYRNHALDLSEMVEKMRAEQDGLSKSLEQSLDKMRDMSLSAQVGAQSLSEASEKGRETVEALADAARLTDSAVKTRFAEMEDMVKYSTNRAESISETAARQVKSSLAQTRDEIARIEAEMMTLMDKLRNVETSHSTPSHGALAAGTAPPLRGSKNRTPIKVHPIEPAPAKPASQEPYVLERNMVAPPMTKPAHSEESLRRPAAEDNTKSKASRWNWLGKFSSTSEPTMLDDFVSAPSAKPIVTDSEIINRLTILGLSPAAIVDDGSIIEAANSRKAKGAKAMSKVTAKRLNDPVRHLYMAMETDSQLKSDVQAFAADYQNRLAPIEDDREAIRQQLESDAGRAFILCDAAINA